MGAIARAESVEIAEKKLSEVGARGSAPNRTWAEVACLAVMQRKYEETIAKNNRDAEDLRIELDRARAELKAHNEAAADALDRLWKEIVLQRKPAYGDWEYPGQAYRHIVAEVKQIATERDDALKAFAEGRPTVYPQMEREAIAATLAELRAEVREWLCVTCNTVYPGPPAEGVRCVVCPKCSGSCGPRTSMELRVAKTELAEVKRERDELRAGNVAACDLVRSLWREHLDLEGARDGHDCESYTDPRTNACTICANQAAVDAVLAAVARGPE